jgi:hypothetical protein
MFSLGEKRVQKIPWEMAECHYGFYGRMKKEGSWDVLNSKIKILNNSISMSERPRKLETYRLSNFNMSA